MNASDRILPLLSGVRPRGSDGWSARCPSHDDHSPSLTIRQISDRVLIHCWTGCSPAHVVGALGLSLADLFDSSNWMPDPKTLGDREVIAGFDAWREFELIGTAQGLRARDNLIAKAQEGLLRGVYSEDQAFEILGRAYRDYTYLAHKLETLRTGSASEALEIYRNG